MKNTLNIIKLTFLLLLQILIFNVVTAQNENFVPVNGMTIGPNYIVFEAEATESPLGKWQIITPEDSRYKNSSVAPINKTHLEFTGNDHNSGPATSPLVYKFKCPKTGTYRLGGRLYQRLQGQPDDKCNDVYIRMAGNFTSANSIPTSVLKTNQKFFGRGVDKWGALYSIDTHDYGQAPVLYNLIEGEIYSFTVSGRAQRTNVDYWILYDNSISYTLGAHKDIAALNNKKYLPQVIPQTWTIEHPVIWATADERPQILEMIENYTWARSIYEQIQGEVNNKLATHQTNPEAILNTIPSFPANDGNSEAASSALARDHKKVLIVASYSGMLYYLTKDEKYAQFTADILAYYIDVLAARTPQTTTISGNYFYDPRTTYNHFAIAYDFIYNFLKKPETSVYEKASGTYIPFDNEKAQKALSNIVGNALKEYGAGDTHGKFISNHPVLTAPGALFPILCIEDDAERQRLFDVFWDKGTSRQNSFKNTILPMFGDQGIWPESTSYSFMPNISLILNVIDRIKPEMKVAESNQHIFNGNFLFSNLRNPDRTFVRYGDSKRKTDATATNYRYALDIAERKGYQDLKEKSQIALKQNYKANGGYKPNLSTGTFDNYSSLELFWGHPLPDTEIGDIDYKPTVIVKHAGVALQRNFVEKSNTIYGLNGIIGGAHYVHSHVTGIAMELYGAGYVMAPNGGLPNSVAERKLPVHTNYFRLYAGNNTVIVNGTSHGRQSGSWNSNSYLWQNTTVNIASEPKHLEDPISKSFSFATQFLDDEVNNTNQQRTLSTIRTSETTAYYFDMFRSKSLSENKFHDYIYHNIGDETLISNEVNQAMDVKPTDRYQNDIGDPVKSPGWRFFENTEVTEPTDEAVKVRFKVNYNNRYMHMFVPGGVEREYTTALAPPTREAKNGYDKKKTQVLAIRQQGEAWDTPFVQIFEPATSANSSIVKVENLYNGEVIVGAKVISEIGNKTIEDYILCLPSSSGTVTLPDQGISFTGRFAIVRKEQDLETAFTTLYIGEGDSLIYGDFTLKTETDRKGILVEEGEPYFGQQLLFKNINNKDVIPKGTNLSIEAIVGEEYSEVTLWGNDTVNLGLKTEAPFVWSDHPLLTNIQNDVYTFTLIANGDLGLTKRNTILIETPSQKPYPNRDEPHAIPGKIEFEDYDSGGDGLGYFDKTNQNVSLYSYRDSIDKVDLGRNGTVVSSMEEGEWLEYTVDVKQSGYYQLNVRHRTSVTPGVKGFSVILPNEEDTVLNNVETLYTGRSEFYVDPVGEFFLKKGKQVLRFSILDSGFDLDYMEIKLTEATNANRVTKESKEIIVFPNPANDNVTIALEGFDNAEISIYSVSGQLMFHQLTNESTFRLSRSSEYKPGVYIVKVLDENKQAYHKKLIFN